MNIQGQWTGIVTYGKEYREHKNKELYFDLDITQDNDKIIGNSIDIGGVGMNTDPAKIIGTIIGNKISFIKQYSSFHYYENGKTKIDKSKPGNEINYSGEYDDLNQVFNGNWIIKGKVMLFGFVPIKYINTGTWSMRRK